MLRFLLSLATVVGLSASNAFADKLRCGIGNDTEKLEYVKEAEINRKDKTLTLKFEDRNKVGLKYYQAKIYFDYKADGDKDKDVVELILAPVTGYTAISSQKILNLEGGEAFTLYLVKSTTNYVQLLCTVEESITLK